mmetsp:Transcript_16179/g.45086  ORF Transcript_16179/g.45086 Transcript_16179/m.45086 type:complete len:107 (-) Transcript_16179:239-559(-)
MCDRQAPAGRARPEQVGGGTVVRRIVAPQQSNLRRGLPQEAAVAARRLRPEGTAVPEARAAAAGGEHSRRVIFPSHPSSSYQRTQNWHRPGTGGGRDGGHSYGTDR